MEVKGEKMCGIGQGERIGIGLPVFPSWVAQFKIKNIFWNRPLTQTFYLLANKSFVITNKPLEIFQNTFNYTNAQIFKFHSIIALDILKNFKKLPPTLKFYYNLILFKIVFLTPLFTKIPKLSKAKNDQNAL